MSPRYWYFGPLKKYAAHWISTLRVRRSLYNKNFFFFFARYFCFLEPAILMSASFRSGLWFGTSRYPTWPRHFDLLTCRLKRNPGPACWIASPADWETTGTLPSKVASAWSRDMSDCECKSKMVSMLKFGLLCVLAPPAPPAEEPEQWQQQQLSTLELYIQTHNKNPIQRVSRWIVEFLKQLTNC